MYHNRLRFVGEWALILPYNDVPIVADVDLYRHPFFDDCGHAAWLRSTVRVGSDPKGYSMRRTASTNSRSSACE